LSYGIDNEHGNNLVEIRFYLEVFQLKDNKLIVADIKGAGTAKKFPVKVVFPAVKYNL
jgi:hypothetical protein